ncbi:hypothetical protein AVEN_29442-1 [Araneus ventricosus]|uniref:Uncharacterized protein n=1 Tax=Araneus ventricosus TaxID=182803 RepID=A0A4Y2D216_ARAVE|nr:hypothetical protein AVEN_29442-1 [Araneus ventricosus]
MYPMSMFGVPQPSLGIYCRRNSTSGTAGGRIPIQVAYAITTARRNCTEASVHSTLIFRSDVSPECCSHPTNPRAIGTGYLFCAKSSRNTH